MLRALPVLLAAALLAAPAAPTLAAPPAGQVSVSASERFALSLRDALHSGDLAQVRRYFSVANDPILKYLAARWDDMRAGRLDPVAWEIAFEPYFADANGLTGQLSVAARQADGTRVGRRFDVTLLQRGQAWLVGEPIAYDRQDTRLARHDMTVDLRRPGELDAQDALTLEASGPDRHVYLRLHPSLRVSEVRFGQAAVPFTQLREVLHLERPDGPGPFVVTVRYAGTLPASDWDFVRPEGTVLRSEFLWYPRPAVGGAFTQYRLRAQVPAEQQAVAVGDLEGIDRFSDGWVYQYGTTRPVEGMSVYAGQYEHFEALAGDLRLEAFMAAGRGDAAPLFLTEAAKVLNFYGGRYGRYPYRKFALVETGFPGGYGATSAVALPHAAFEQPAIADDFLAHEIAHNWTDLVSYKGPLGVRGFMAEGVASYLDMLYHGARDGAPAFRKRLQDAQRRYGQIAGTVKDVPLTEADQDDRGHWQALTYDKGAIVLHMLRRTIGDKAFDQGLRALYADKAGQEVGIEAFQASFEKASGQHLGYFFRQWLERPGLPQLEVEALKLTSLGGGHYELAGTLAQRTMPFVLTVPLVVVTDKDEMLYQLPVRSFQTSFRLRVTGRPRVLMIDPLRDALLSAGPPIPLP